MAEPTALREKDQAERISISDKAPGGRRWLPSGEGIGLWAGRLLLVVGFIVLWEFAADRWIRSFFISRPLDVARYIWDGFETGFLIRHIRVTGTEWAVGFTLGIVMGLLGGVAMFRFRRLARILDPFFVAINGIPRVALGPLIIVWFGIGILSKIVLVWSLVVFLVFFNTYAGLRTVSPDLVKLARVFGASEWAVLWKVALPWSVPWIMTAIKLSIPYGFIGAIVGEFIASTAGIGYLVRYAANLYNASASIGIIIVLAGIIMVLNALLGVVERLVLRHRPESRELAGTTM